MADGRKIPYIIEMIADDSQLRKQMKGMNWKNIIGSNADGFVNLLGQEGKEAKERIESELMKLDLDWVKIFGMDKLEAALSRTFAKSRKQIDSALVDVDTKKIQTTIEFIEGLGKAFDEMGAKFEAGSAARSLAPLLRTLEEIPDAVDRVMTAFDKLSNSGKLNFTPTINSKEIINEAETMMAGVGKVVATQAHQVSKAVEQAYNKATSTITTLTSSRASAYGIKTQQELQKMLNGLKKEYLNFTEDANYADSPKKAQEAYAAAAKAAKDYLDLVKWADSSAAEKQGLVRGNFVTVSDYDMQEMKAAIDTQIQYAQQQIKRYEDEVQNAFQLNLADTLTENLKSLNLKISLPKESEFTKQINGYISRINKKRLEKIKTTIDVADTLSAQPKNSQKDVDKQNVKAIESKFAKIDEVIDNQQQSILTKTREWRKNMQDAIVQGGVNSISFGFKWDSADVDSIASDIFENLQEFFAQEDHKIAIRIDEEALLNGIKGVLGDKTIAIGGGGGNVNIDPTSIAEAVKVGIRSAILGKPIPTNKVQKSSDKQSKSGSQEDDKPTPKHTIDVNKTYTTHLIDTLKDIAKYATKENKDGNVNQKQKDVLNFFAGKGINLRDLGDTDNDVAKILEQVLFTTDKQGKIRSSDLVDAIEKFKSRSKVNWKSLDELTRAVRILLTSFGEEAEYEDSKIIDNQSNEIIRDASKKAKGVQGLRRIKNYYSKSNQQYNERNLPDEANIDQIIKLSEQMETDGLLAEQLQILKEARQTLGDKTDDKSIAEFQAVYQEVWGKIEQRFYDLVNYLQAFSGKLDIQGRKTPVKLSNKTREDKSRTVNTLANLKENVVIEHAEIFTSPNDQSIGLGIKSPKTGRVSQGQERSLLKGSSRTSFTVRDDHADETDIRYRTYDAIDDAATSYFNRGDVLQRLGWSTNDASTTTETVEHYNNLIKAEEERLKVATETAALNEQFRQDVKKLLGNQVEYTTPTIDKKAITAYSAELDEQRKKLIENQTAQEKVNSALKDGAEWLDKVWPQEMEEAKRSGDNSRQQALLSRRDAVISSQAGLEARRNALLTEETSIKGRVQDLTSFIAEGIQKPITNVIGETLRSIQKLSAEYGDVTQGTPEEYAIVGKAQELLQILKSAEQDAIQRLEQFGISVDSVLTQEQKEIVELATKAFVTDQKNSKKDIRRNVVERSHSSVPAIEGEIDRLKTQRNELIQRKEQEYLQQLINNSKISEEVLAGLQAESDARSARYSALDKLDKVQSNLSLAYQKRNDASSRINYVNEQQGKLDKLGLSAKGTFGNDVLEERKRAHANEFFASDWYFNEVQRIRSETTDEMKAVEERIKQKHQKWRQVVDKEKQAVVQEIASETINLDDVRARAEEEFSKSKKYKGVQKSQEKKRDSKLAEIQTKINQEVDKMVQSAMEYQTEAIEAEAQNIAKSRGRKTASEADYKNARKQVEENLKSIMANRVEAKYAVEKTAAESEMRMAIENAIVQAGNRAVQQAIDEVLKGKDKQVRQRMYEAISVREEKLRTNSKFQGMTGNLLTDYDNAQQGIYTKRKQDIKELSRSYYDNLISEDGVLSIPKSRNEDGTWIVTTEDVRAIVNARLEAMLEGAYDDKGNKISNGAEEDKAAAQESIDKYSAMRGTIVSEQGLTEEEVYNRKLAQAMILEQERQVRYQEDIDLLNKILEDEGLTKDQRTDIKAKIRGLETNLQESKLLVEALQTRRDAAWTQKNTKTQSNEEKITKNEERIASYTESIAKSQDRQNQLRTQISEVSEKINSATEEEKKKLEEQQATLTSRLEDEKKTEENLKRDRARRKQENERLRKSPTDVADSTTEKTDKGILGVITRTIKDAIGEQGGLSGDVSGLAKDETLQQILATLTGGQVVRDSEMDKKLARIAELEAKSKTTNTKVQEKETAKPKDKKKKEELPDYIAQAKKYEKETLKKTTSQEELSTIAKDLVANIESAKQGTKEATELQLKLQKVISRSGQLYKESSGEKRYKVEDIGRLLGIDGKVGLKLTEDAARKIAESGFVKSIGARRKEDLTAYHGTKNGGFTAFDMSKYRSGQAIYLTDTKAVAVTYAGGSDKDIDLASGQMGQKGVYTVNVTADKVLTVDANGAIWSQLGSKGSIDGKPLVCSTNKLGYKLNATQNPETSEIYYDKSSFIGIDDDSLPKLSLEGTAEQIAKQMLGAGYTQEIVDLILYRSKQDIQLSLDKLKQGQMVTTKPRYGTIGFNKELQKLAQETTDDVVEQAFVQGYDRVDFKNIRDIGPGISKNAGKLTSLSTMHAIKSASQIQIINPSEQQKKTELVEREAKAEEKITKEKKEQKVITSGLSKAEKDELARLKEEVKPKVVSSNETTSGGVGSLAREDTLSKILEVLNAFKSDGVKVTGKKQTDIKEKAPKVEKTEAELIKERALKDKDAVLGIAATSKVKKKYEQLVKQLESESDLGKIKALAQKASALGFNIKKESADWDYRTADANRVYNIPNANTFGKRPETVRKSMEKLAQTKFNPDGKQYEFLNFDGKQLVYQLTDVRGNVEKVTMEWSELNNQVAITSDKSGHKMNELAEKVRSFGEKFENAIDAGYLAENDEDLERFKNKVIEIQNEIAKGASFDDIDKLRNEALRIADEVNKKVNKTKRSYSGTTEINAVTKQHDNLEFSGVLDQEDIGAVKAYNKAYAELLAKHNEFKTAGTLYDPNNQKLLQQMAIQVKALGKELDIAQSEMQDLQQKVLNSGTYNGKAIGDISQVQQGVDVYSQMRAKLEELGATNIKVDRIHQKATGTIRVNNRVVHDLEVAYHELSGSMARYHKQERESLTGVPAFLNGFKKKFNSIMQYLSMTMSIHQVLAQLRKGVQYVREIDLALTELKKVTDETEAEYDQFLQTAAKTGARLGSTISAVTEATATFAKLGYSMQQASEMAEAAIVYKNVGDNIASTEDAADSIISTLKGFGLEASESMAIVDKFNEVGELNCPSHIVIYD